MKNRYEVRGDEVVIFLPRKDGEDLETIISFCDFDRANEYEATWTARKSWYTDSFYVQGNMWINGKRTTRPFHRWLTKAPDGMVVDHINGDTLRNTRDNLRVITQQQNMQNRKGATKTAKSGIRNVRWEDDSQKWRVVLRLGGKTIHIGRYDDLEEAKTAAVEARAKHFPFSQEALRRRSG